MRVPFKSHGCPMIFIGLFFTTNLARRIASITDVNWRMYLGDMRRHKSEIFAWSCCRSASASDMWHRADVRQANINCMNNTERILKFKCRRPSESQQQCQKNANRYNSVRRTTMYLQRQQTLYCRIPVTHMGRLTEIRGRSASNVVVVVVFRVFLVYYCSLVACAAHVFGKTTDDTQFGRIGTVFSQLFSLWEYFVCKWVKYIISRASEYKQ